MGVVLGSCLLIIGLFVAEGLEGSDKCRAVLV